MYSPQTDPVFTDISQQVPQVSPNHQQMINKDGIDIDYIVRLLKYYYDRHTNKSELFTLAFRQLIYEICSDYIKCRKPNIPHDTEISRQYKLQRIEVLAMLLRLLLPWRGSELWKIYAVEFQALVTDYFDYILRREARDKYKIKDIESFINELFEILLYKKNNPRLASYDPTYYFFTVFTNYFFKDIAGKYAEKEHKHNNDIDIDAIPNPDAVLPPVHDNYNYGVDLNDVVDRMNNKIDPEFVREEIKKEENISRRLFLESICDENMRNRNENLQILNEQIKENGGEILSENKYNLYRYQCVNDPFICKYAKYMKDGYIVTYLKLRPADLPMLDKHKKIFQKELDIDEKELNRLLKFSFSKCKKPKIKDCGSDD